MLWLSRLRTDTLCLCVDVHCQSSWPRSIQSILCPWHDHFIYSRPCKRKHGSPSDDKEQDMVPMKKKKNNCHKFALRLKGALSVGSNILSKLPYNSPRFYPTILRKARAGYLLLGRTGGAGAGEEWNGSPRSSESFFNGRPRDREILWGAEQGQSQRGRQGGGEKVTTLVAGTQPPQDQRWGPRVALDSMKGKVRSLLGNHNPS